MAARAAEEPLIEAVLRPGDCLYLPRGYLHAATALGGVSTHLTLGVHSWTRYALAEQLLQQALHTIAQDPAVRGSLALGVDLGDPHSLRADADLVREALVSALGNSDLDRLSATLSAQARTTQRAAPVGPLRQLRTAGELAPEVRLVLRRHLAAALDSSGSRSILHSRAADFAVSEDEAPAVKALLENGSALVADLGEELARRLVLAGLATTE